jgi:uncharacterized protein (TIGR03118 family)
MTAAPGENFWVSANGSGKALLYKVDPATQASTKDNLTISIPGNGSVTGQASSYGSPNFAPDNRTYNSSIIGQSIFVSEDGIISSWTSEYIYVKNPEGCGFEHGCDPNYTTGAMHFIADLATANYKGAASASAWGGHYLYAANFKAGTIDVFKGETSAPPLTGTFMDPNLPKGYAPFNVQTLNGSLYVTYALQDAGRQDAVAGAGHGFVDQFTLNGDFVGRVASGGTLDSPWGLTIAPSSFGAMAGDLLVGNSGDGHINIYDPATHAYLGQVLDAHNQPITIDGLWAISPGNDGSAGSSHLLYFTAGPGNETHGLFGVLAPVPEPSEYTMMLAGLGLLIFVSRRRTLHAKAA